MRRYSIVIPNFNYGHYLAAAIESALSLDWPDVEVIVVDDGSTDSSREVIRSYGDRIVAILQPANRGQREACNAGFASSTGDVVIFLDSDDTLQPNALHGMDRAWTHTVSKVQVQMSRVDAEGESLDRVFPRFRHVPTPEQIKRWYYRTTAYPTPPGSGNAYRREFLDRIMPIGQDGDDFIDSSLLATAPLFGEVVTIREPLANYRIHGGNDSDILADDSRFSREIARAVKRFTWAQACVDRDRRVPASALFRSRELLQLRVAEAAIRSGTRSLPGDSRARLARDILLSPLHPGPETVAHRLIVVVWCLVTITMPLRVKRAALRRRFHRG